MRPLEYVVSLGANVPGEMSTMLQRSVWRPLAAGATMTVPLAIPSPLGLGVASLSVALMQRGSQGTAPQ